MSWWWWWPARDEGSKGMCSPASSDAISLKQFLPHQRDHLMVNCLESSSWSSSSCKHSFLFSAFLCISLERNPWSASGSSDAPRQCHSSQESAWKIFFDGRIGISLFLPPTLQWMHQTRCSLDAFTYMLLCNKFKSSTKVEQKLKKVEKKLKSSWKAWLSGRLLWSARGGTASADCDLLQLHQSEQMQMLQRAKY